MGVEGEEHNEALEEARHDSELRGGHEDLRIAVDDLPTR